MGDWLGIALLFAMGAALVVADIFLPSHFLLTLCALGLFGYGFYLMFGISELAGLLGVLAFAALIPVTLLAFLKIWPRTWIGRRIAPPNPVLTEADRMPVAQLERLVGCLGRTATVLRPVGTCVFDGERFECVAERGVISAGVAVECIRLIDRTLCVRPAPESSDQDQT
jgi:membrane-bound serine protease (ClpP class)